MKNVSKFLKNSEPERDPLTFITCTCISSWVNIIKRPGLHTRTFQHTRTTGTSPFTCLSFDIVPLITKTTCNPQID